MYGIMGTYPKEALPLITTLIEKSDQKPTSIAAVEAILHMHYKDLSQDEIRRVKEVLERTLDKRESVEGQFIACVAKQTPGRK